MAIRNVLYGHAVNEVWCWILVAIVAGLVVAVWWVLRSRDEVARDLSYARDELRRIRSDLSYTRAELRRLQMQWARARTPAKTCVLPALPSDDPEEFKRTQCL